MIPLEDPEGHRWVSPPPADCPNCECCSWRLCNQAKGQQLSCGWLSPPQPGQHDTSKCPCTTGPERKENG